jgi:Transposase DDE domain
MYLTALATWMHTLFGARADELARTHLLIKRQRAFSGAQFLQALVFGWLKRPAVPLEHIAYTLGISRQSLDQRWTPAASAFCRAVLEEAAAQVFRTRAEVFDLLQPFKAVYVDDTTQLPLPDACAGAWPGCGSGLEGRGKAGMKALARFEITAGRVAHLSLHPARTADPKAAATAPELPAGCLHMADLGFTDFGKLQGYAERGGYFISRVPVQTRVRLAGDAGGVPLAELLRQRRVAGEVVLDLGSTLGNKDRVTGRLVALACPPEVAARRLRRLEEGARRRNRAVSERQRELCRWQVLVTNVAGDRLSPRQVWEVYRLRWQVELLFKRLKSEGGLGASRSGNAERVQCEWCLKLLGQVVRNWLMLLRGGPLGGVNPVQLGRVIQDWLDRLQDALGSTAELDRVLGALEEALGRVRPRTARRKGQAASQRLAAEVPSAA